jgi:hypothetical protein
VQKAISERAMGGSADLGADDIDGRLRPLTCVCHPTGWTGGMCGFGAISRGRGGKERWYGS